MYHERRILVTAPCYNEELKIGHVVQRIQALRPVLADEILIVDDGSTDSSASVAASHGAHVISLGACLGVGAAIRRALHYGRENAFDICVILAGNNKDDPNEIPRLLDPLVTDAADFVQGSRYLAGGMHGNMPLYRRLATRLHPLLFSLITGKRLTESTNGFRAFRLDLFDDPRIDMDQSWLDHYELEPYLLYKTIRLGYRHVEVPCTKVYPPRELGQTKMKPITGWWSILRPLFLLGLGLRR